MTGLAPFASVNVGNKTSEDTAMKTVRRNCSKTVAGWIASERLSELESQPPTDQEFPGIISNIAK